MRHGGRWGLCRLSVLSLRATVTALCMSQFTGILVITGILISGRGQTCKRVCACKQRDRNKISMCAPHRMHAYTQTHLRACTFVQTPTHTHTRTHLEGWGANAIQIIGTRSCTSSMSPGLANTMRICLNRCCKRAPLSAY